MAQLMADAMQNVPNTTQVSAPNDIAGAKGPEGRPPPPPPGGGASDAQTGDADPAALLQNLFETVEASESEEDSDEITLIDTLTTIASDGYETTQSLFGS
ncbi:hypothetical protein OO012_04045 [Rhodobacteraceae bacterium KMM 6894]|nr:hypothetical protein [Rhodobacteraceae bacterium KMM 6894]